MMIKKNLSVSVICILLHTALFSQSQGATYCGPYVISPPIILNGIKDSIISGLEISNPIGHCITLVNCSNITIQQCKLGTSSGIGINIHNSDNVLVTDCRMDSVATGVYAQTSTKIQVSNINVKNVIGPFPRGQMVQFNQVNGPENKINYNIAENILGESYPEDVISIYMSNGSISDPIQVFGNWIRGGGPSASGGGIMTGDNGGSYILVKDNILVDPGQYGIAIAGGDSIQLINNAIYGKQQPFTNVGIYVWNQYPWACSNHTVTGNEVKWTNSIGQSNHYWNGNNCGIINGWSNNSWGANIDSTILPEQILLNCTSLDIYDNEIFNKVTIYPNPNQGIVNIDLATLKDVSINVYNIKGQLVFQEENINSKVYQFKLKDSTGIYVIKIISNGESQNYKLILK